MSSQPVGRGVAMREARRADLREERAIAERADDSLRADSARARLVDAQTVLDGVAEVGPNYQVRKAEGQRARRARLADAVLAAAQSQIDETAHKGQEVNRDRHRHRDGHSKFCPGHRKRGSGSSAASCPPSRSAVVFHSTMISY